ncbi:MAG: flagellin [Macromonas sp.]
MANSINTNHYASTAQRHIFNAQTKLAPSMERLASGLRINSAKDDPTGLVVGSKMESGIRASTQIIKGMNDGIGLLSTAQGGLTQVSDLLQKARELAIRSSNESLSSSDRETINREYAHILDEINRVANTTEMFGIYPLKGPPTLGDTPRIDTKYQNGVEVGSIPSGINPMAFIPEGTTDITIEIDAYGADDDIQLFTVDGKHLVGTPLSDAMWSSNGVSSNADVQNRVFSTQNGFSPTASYDDSNLLSGTTSFTYPISTTPVNGLSGSYNGMNFVYSGDADWIDGGSNDGAVVTNPNDKFEQIHIDKTTEPLMLMAVGSGIFAITVSWASVPTASVDEFGRRTGPIDIPVEDASAIAPAPGSVRIEQTPSDTATLGLSGTALDPFAAAVKAISALDDALGTVSSYRGTHASIESRFDAAINYTATHQDSTQTARSRIIDADYAAETANVAAATILQKAGLSMLAQANIEPNHIMKLLRWGGQ